MALSTTQYGYIIDPMVPFTDDSGTTIRNGYVRVFVAGSSTPVITYKNYDGATNEEAVQLDNSGRTAYPVIVSKGSTYKVCVYDAEHSQESPVLTIDKVVPAGANVEATNIVTGLDNVESPEAGWVKASVSGTDAEVSLDATNVTSEVDTMVEATAASSDYMMPLVHKTGSDPDKKITLGNIFKFVLNFIHSLTDTATESDLVSGNYLALDGSAGTKKLNSTTLLTKTAQNALAGIIASAFNPNRTSENPYNPGDVVIEGGKAYSFKNSHYGAWNASDVTTAILNSMQYISLSSSNISSYNDADNFPENSAIRCSSSSLVSQISHLPISSQFAMFTYSAGGIRYQLCIVSGSNDLYFRRAWASWANWSKLMDTKKGVNLIGNKDSASAQVAPYNDLNTLPINEIVSYIASYGYVSNCPVNEGFQVVTFGATDGIKMQLLSTNSRKILIRSYWNPTWSDWFSFESVENLALSFGPDFKSSENYLAGKIICRDGRLKKAFKSISSGGSYTAADWENVDLESYKRTNITVDNVSYYNDADNFLPESVISCLNTALLSQISHLPVSTQFTCYSFKGGSDAIAMQLFISASTNELYFRRKWTSWTPWRKFSFADEGEPNPNPLFAFDNIVAVGDSLTWCQVYTSANTSRQAKKLWADMLAHSCDATAQTIARAGDTSIDSWARVDANLTEKDNAVIIVYLGTNGGLTDTLDTDAPSADPYTDWADTNTGCYAKIVAKAQSLGYKVLLIKPWAGGGGSLTTTNEVIDKIGVRFGCCVVGPFKTTESKYHYYPDLSGTNTLHYNDLGYAWFATALPYYVSRADNNQLKYIIPS